MAAVLLSNKARIAKWIQKGKDLFGYKDCVRTTDRECSACGAVQCQRHIVEVEPCSLWLDEELDRAVGEFYSVILNNFISSWFSTLSSDEEFVHLVRQCLRDATCRLGVALQGLDMPKLITERLLPVCFAHSDTLSKLLLDGVPMAQLSSTFILHEHPLHPAVCNRQSEIQYLRSVAHLLIPKLIPSTQQHLQSPAFHSLLRELIACWVLLPLLDVIADPNLLNALIIAATDAPVKRVYIDGAKVAFLESFVGAKAQPPTTTIAHHDDMDLLQDQTKLYAFMQFLKREGAVDLLRFHLDVDHLNSELQDPRVTTDPAKLSALQQQSEKLLQHYQSTLVPKMWGDLRTTDALNGAHEMIKAALLGRWRCQFSKTPEYFQLIYGETTVAEGRDSMAGGAKGELRQGQKGPAEGVDLAAWDGFSEGAVAAGGQPHSNATIYSSVTQKLRKERGQNLDQFMATFMQSIEQSTDVGEDVCLQQASGGGGATTEAREPPGKNLVFGDLFELRRPPNGKEALNYHLHPVRGPSKCFIYIGELVVCPMELL